MDGADVTAKGNNGKTPLYHAYQYKNENRIKILSLSLKQK